MRIKAPTAPRAPGPVGQSTAGPAGAEATLTAAGQRLLPISLLPAAPGYEVLELLGQGGMGAVYKARQLSLNRTVALKMIPVDRPAEASVLGRFRTEVEAVARLRHPHIVQIYEVGEHQGRPFFSMEYVEGGSLALKLSRGLPTPREAAALVETLARAVQHAHARGIVHRDLKPGNILLEPDGAPKVTDFGVARLVSDDPEITGWFGPTRTGDILGTPNYMAPEQAAGRTREAGPAADIYSLGAILYECLAGRPPFAGPTPVAALHQVIHDDPVPPAQVQPRVPRDLQTICLRCLEKEPARRYATAADLADDLCAFLAGESIRARPAGPRQRLKRWARRRPTAAVLLAVAAVAVAGVIVGAWWHSPLVAGGLAVLGLLAGAGWYSARLRAALHEVRRQQALAERGVERLHLLLDTTQRLLAVTHPDELLRLLGETTTRLTNAERATIYLLDRERGELWSKVATGEQVGEIRVPLGTGIAGTVAATGEVINLDNPYADPRFNAEIDRRTGYTTRSLLTLPMTGADGKVVGVFQVLNKRSGAFGAEDVEILQSLAASAALAVGNAERGTAEPRTELC
jgi:putative methionine-R-sulfoxide reductase with GAF domain/predicted Ser/Thr protein kinase